MATPNAHLDTWEPGLPEHEIEGIANDFNTDEVVVLELKADSVIQVAILDLIVYIKGNNRVFELNTPWKLAAIKFCSNTETYKDYVSEHTHTRPSDGRRVVRPGELFGEEVEYRAGRAAVKEIMKALDKLEHNPTVQEYGIRRMEIWRMFCALMFMFVKSTASRWRSSRIVRRGLADCDAFADE